MRPDLSAPEPVPAFAPAVSAAPVPSRPLRIATGVLGACAVGCAAFVVIGKAPFNVFFWLGALAFVAVAALDRGTLRRCLREPVALGGVLLFALYAASLAWTTAPRPVALGQVASYRVLLMPLIFLPVLAVPAWRERAWRALLFSSGVVLLLSLAQWLHPLPFAAATRNPVALEIRDAYVFSDRIRQAIQLGPLFLFAAMAALFGTPPGRRARLLSWGLTAFTAAGLLFLLQGRTGVLVFAALTLYLLHARFGARGVAAGLGIVMLAAALVLASGSRLGGTWSEIQAYLTHGANNASGERLEMWRNALRMFVEDPVLGGGIESYPFRSQALYAASGRVPDEVYHDPHQEFLYVAAELGLAGLLLLVGGLVGTWRIAARFDPRWARLTRGFVVLFVAAGLVNCLWNIGWTGYLFGLLLALVAGRHALHRAGVSGDGTAQARDARSFVILRHDNLGDVALALPMAGLLKRAVPGCTVRFAVRRYARDVAVASRYVDDVIVVTDADAFERDLRALRPDAIVFAFPSRELARAAARAGVPIRVGTARRWFHWAWATHRPFVRRKGSALHEAQLNLALLAPFIDAPVLPCEALWPLAGLAPEDGAGGAPEGTLPGATRRAATDPATNPATNPPTVGTDVVDRPSAWPLRPGVANVLLQVRSNGNGKEWPLRHYVSLVESMPADRYHFIVNGTPAEGDALRAAAPALFSLPQVTDATRGFPIPDLMRVLPRLDAVLSNSTGPMHLAALSGAATIGLFVDLPGMDPARWGPLGPRATALRAPREACVQCPRGAPECPCMAAIDVARVAAALEAATRRRAGPDVAAAG